MIEDAAQSPHVGGLGSRLIMHTFWRHILTRTDKILVLSSLGIVINKSVANFWLQHVIRGAKINQFHLIKLIRGEEHVLWFQVPVNNADLVDLLDALTDLKECVSYKRILEEAK